VPAMLLSVVPMASRDSLVAVKCKYILMRLPELYLSQAPKATNCSSWWEFAMAMSAATSGNH